MTSKFYVGDRIFYNFDTHVKCDGDYVVTSIEEDGSVNAVDHSHRQIQPRVRFNADGSTTWPADDHREEHTPDIGSYFTHRDDVTKSEFKLGDRVVYGNISPEATVVEVDTYNRIIIIEVKWRGCRFRRAATLEGTSLVARGKPFATLVESIDTNSTIKLLTPVLEPFVPGVDMEAMPDDKLAEIARRGWYEFCQAERVLRGRGWGVTRNDIEGELSVTIRRNQEI